MTQEYIVIECPHCNLLVQIFKKEINCQIFRHAIYKDNFRFVDPHSSKNFLEDLKEKNLIYGCGKPFKFNGKKTIICDYI